MKILFLSDNFPPETNAAASRVLERARHWRKWGHEVTILTSAPNKPQGRVYQGYKNHWRSVEVLEGIRVVRVKTFIVANEGFFLRVLDFLSYMFMAVAFGWWEKKPDVVVATSPQFFTAVAGWALAKRFRVPFIFEVADLWPASISAVGAIKQGLVIRCLEKIELFLYRQAKVVVVLTQSFQEDLVGRGIDAAKIHVIINGVEMSAFYPLPPEPLLVKELGLEGKFVVGYIGTLGAAHGLEAVLTAARILAESPASRAHFLFVGDGAEAEKLKKLKSEMGLNNVSFVGQQPKAEIIKYWSLCDAALVSLRGGHVLTTVIPSKIFEAMACGKPIVLAAPKGEATQIIESTGSGCISDAEDPEMLARNVRQMSESRDLFESFKRASLKSAKNFSRECQAKAMIEAFDSALRPQEPRP